jgi:hypothetical protein
MTTAVDICNLALGHIGKAEISSFDEASSEARECRRFYDGARRAYLQRSDWTFARRRIAMAQLDAAFTERWTFTYARPSGALKVLRVLSQPFDPRQNPLPAPFEVRENLVFTDMAAAVAEITLDLVDLSTYSPLFIEAISYRLAQLIARPLTKSSKLVHEMGEEARQHLSLAVAQDAAQDVHRYSYDAEAIIDRDAQPAPFWAR